MVRAFVNWFRRSWFAYGYDGEGTAPLEAIAWRLFGVFILAAFVAITFVTHPHPGLHAPRDIGVLASFVAFVVFAIAAHPERRNMPARQRILALLGVIVAAGCLGAFQPHGVWVLGPYYVAIVAALNLDRRAAWLVFLAAIAPFLAGYLSTGQVANAGTFLSGILPWFFAMRLLHYVAEQRDELKASRASEAEAAAAAERGRLAREMHDVLAHSLSALATSWRRRACSPATVTSIPTSRWRSTGRTTSRRAVSTRRAGRSRPSAAMSCRDRSGSARSRTRSRSRAAFRSRSRFAVSRASSHPRRAWRCTAPRRRPSPTSAATPPPSGWTSSWTQPGQHRAGRRGPHDPRVPAGGHDRPERRLRSDRDA